MSRNWIQNKLRQWLPKEAEIKNHKYLRFMSRHLKNPALWTLNAASIRRAVVIGVFWGFMPMPLQMVPVILLCIACRANVILALIMIWVSNPLTMPPLMLLQYHLGHWLLDSSPVTFSLDIHHLFSQLSLIWQPLYVGAVISGAIAALLGYVIAYAGTWWYYRRKEKASC